MSEQEQVEYAGLAAALGRITMALKQTESALIEAQKRIAELEAKEPAEVPWPENSTTLSGLGAEE